MTLQHLALEINLCAEFLLLHIVVSNMAVEMHCTFEFLVWLCYYWVLLLKIMIILRCWIISNLSYLFISYVWFKNVWLVNVVKTISLV